MNDDIYQTFLSSLDALLQQDNVEKKSVTRRILRQDRIEDYSKAEDWYETIRQDNTDVELISKNIKKHANIVTRIKEHVFYKEHVIIRDDIVEKKRLDCDPEIVNSWCRMRDGDHVENDLKLFRHEQVETIMMQRKSMHQQQAHQYALDAGYKWNPEEAYDGDSGNN